MPAGRNASLRRVSIYRWEADEIDSNDRLLSVRGLSRGPGDGVTIKRPTSNLACLALCIRASQRVCPLTIGDSHGY